MKFADNILVLIPAYEAEKVLPDFLKKLLDIVPKKQVLVVDDGSTDNTKTCAESVGVSVLRHSENCGKGTALANGLAEALRRGFLWMISMDADGQHSPHDLPAFAELATSPKNKVVGIAVGKRSFRLGKMPPARIFSNRVTTAMLGRVAGTAVHDAQCGFRLYKVDAALLSAYPNHGRFDWESEVLVCCVRVGYSIEAVPVRTIYGDESSHIAHVGDTWRFLKLWWRLGQEKQG